MGDMDAESRFVTFKYIDTYYLCSCIKGIIQKPFDHLRFFDDLWSEGQILNYVDGFRKNKSGLEMFISECLWKIYEELTTRVTEDEYLSSGTPGHPSQLTIEVLLDAYKVPYRSFKEAYDKEGILPDEYFYEIESEMRVLTGHLSKEILNVLFFDRSFLQKFNEFLADHLEYFVENYSTDNDAGPIFGEFGAS